MRVSALAEEFEHLGLLFITRTVFGRTRLFHLERYADIVMGSLAYCVNHRWFDLHAYVVMPSHIHLILMVAEDHSVGHILRDFCKYTAQQILFTMQRSDPAMLSKFRVGTSKQEHKVWQRAVNIKNVLSREFLVQKAEYIHQNPLELPGIENPEEYDYSSARFYLQGVEDRYVRLSDFRELT